MKNGFSQMILVGIILVAMTGISALALAGSLEMSSQSDTGHAEEAAALLQRGSGLVLRSPEVIDGGMLPKDYTGDGSSATLPLEWSGAPAGTNSYAIIMHHIDPQGIVKWYWTLYNIPAKVQSLPRNVKGIGILGNNSINGRLEYAPPHSKGPGAKSYIYTLYALSSNLQINIPPEQVNRQSLLAIMKPYILDSATLQVVYSRPEGSTGPKENRNEGPPDRPGPPGDPELMGRDFANLNRMDDVLRR